jgi:acylphosphatase
MIFSGTVQGVGFRYRAQEFANALAVKGTVQNCADGSVELIAEGRESAIDILKERLVKHFGSYIHGIDQSFRILR